MGQWICDGFAFFIENEQGIPTAGYHAGAQTLFKWCYEHKQSLLDLHIGWSADGCFRCLENAVYDVLKPSSTLLNKIHPGSAGQSIDWRRVPVAA
jgi:hypothetical protein